MKKKHKILLLIALICSIMIFFYEYKMNRRYGSDTYGKVTRLMNTRYNTMIYLYGDEIAFRDTVPYTKIQNIVMQDFCDAKNANILIINDLHGNAELKMEDVDSIAPMILDGTLGLIYLGTDKVEMFFDADIWSDQTIDEGELCVCVCKYHNVVSEFVGVWTEYDEEMTEGDPEGLPGQLITFIGSCLKSNK